MSFLVLVFFGCGFIVCFLLLISSRDMARRFGSDLEVVWVYNGFFEWSVLFLKWFILKVGGVFIEEVVRVGADGGKIWEKRSWRFSFRVRFLVMEFVVRELKFFFVGDYI